MINKLFFILILFYFSFILASCDIFKDSEEDVMDENYGDIGRLSLRGYLDINSPVDLVISPDDKYVYVAANFDGIYKYTRDKDTGWLSTNPADFVQVSGLNSLIISSDGKYVYAYDNAIMAIMRFVRNNDTGRLSSPVAKSVPWVDKLYMPPDGSYIYFSNGSMLQWLKRDFSSGNLSGDLTNDFIFFSNIPYLAFSPLGNYAYVASFDTIYWLSRDFSTGKLVGDLGKDNVLLTDYDFNNVLCSIDGKYLFATSWGTMTEFGYFKRESWTGKIDGYFSLNFSSIETACASKDGINVYFYSNSNEIIVYMKEGSKGFKEIDYFTPIGSEMNSIKSMQVTMDGKHVYAAAQMGGSMNTGAVVFFDRQTEMKY